MLIEKTRHTDSLAEYIEEIVKEVNNKQKVYTKEQKELLTIIRITGLKREQIEKMKKK